MALGEYHPSRNEPPKYLYMNKWRVFDPGGPATEARAHLKDHSEAQTSKNYDKVTQRKPKRANTCDWVTQKKPKKAKNVIGSHKNKPKKTKSVMGSHKRSPKGQKCDRVTQKKFKKTKSVMGSHKRSPKGPKV